MNPSDYLQDHQPDETFHCLYCNRILFATDGVFVHDDVPHPIDATFDEEARPQ